MAGLNRKRRWIASGLFLVLITAFIGCQRGEVAALVWFDFAPRFGPAPLVVNFFGHAVPLSGASDKFRDPVIPWEPEPEPADPVTIEAYQWKFGDDSTAVGQVVTHTYTTAGVYQVTLTVLFSDGSTRSSLGNVTVTDPVTPVNTPPVANAGPNQMNRIGDVVQLDGTDSTDADGDPLTFQWFMAGRPAGSDAALSNPAVANPVFTADVAGVYTIQLIVNDGTEDSPPDVVVCTVGATANFAPTADAGPARNVLVGAIVTLDGSSSSDPEAAPLTYAWSFVSIPPNSHAALSDPGAVTPAFTADVEGTYLVRLVVNDGQLDSAPDTVTITASDTANTAPVADAGPDRAATTGAIVPLDGSGSSDADGDALTYAWSLLTRPQGSAADLNTPSSVSPSFLADVAGIYVAQLIVNDGQLDSKPDTMTVTASDTQLERSPPQVAVSPLTYTVVQGRTLEVAVTGTDPDGDVVSLAAAPAMENATFVSMAGTSARGTFAFVPEIGQEGIYTISFTARDPLGLADTKHIQIAVTKVNHPPALSVPANLTIDEGKLLNILLEASDPDGDVLTLTAAPLPDNALFVPATRTIIFAPDYEQAGVYDIICEASDGELSSGPNTLRVTVNDITGGSGEPESLELSVNPVESPSLLKQTRITGTVNAPPTLPPAREITAALITGMNPVSGKQGETLDVVLTGQTEKSYPTHFLNGESTARFGAGITVNSTRVDSANTAVVNLSIAPNADTGPRSVTVQTGAETAVSMLTFNVLRGTARVTGTVVDPDTGLPIAGAIVSVEGTNISTTTDENGQYTLQNVPLGPGILVINPPDHELVRLPIDPQPGDIVDNGETGVRAVVFDPNAPPAATTLSIVGRGFADIIGETTREEAGKLIEDAMILTGGADAGILDAYGNQMNPNFTGEGAWSLTATARETLVDRMARAESYPLQEILYSLSFGMEWTNGPPDLGEWITLLQHDLDQAWRDPTNPGNALLVLLFNKGKTIQLDTPEIIPETRLNAMQASLLASSIMTYATKSAKAPASYLPAVKDASTAMKQSTNNSPPVAKAGPDLAGRTGIMIRLSGVNSFDRDTGDELTYQWELMNQPPESGATLSDAASMTPGIIPDKEGFYKIKLVVSDGKLKSTPDFVNLVIDNSAPVADAGVDRRVEVGETVNLSGAMSEDPGGGVLTFNWSIYSAPSSSKVGLSYADTVNAVLEPDYDGDYIISLVVNNGSKDSEPDYVVITAGNRKPIAYAGLNKVVKVGDEVELNGSLSTDPDDDALTYDWICTSMPAGSAARIENRTSPVAKLKIDAEGIYAVQLIVRDDHSESEPDAIEITTEPSSYFDKYWRNFFTSKESRITEAWAGSAWKDEMALHQWAATVPGAGNIEANMNALEMAGESARDLANSIISNRAVVHVPQPPRIKRGEVLTDPDGTRRVEIELDDTRVYKKSINETYVYRLYRFQGDTEERVLIEEQSFDTLATLILKDTEPLLGSHFYAVNATRYTGVSREKKKNTESWWPTAFSTSITAFTNGRDRLTSDYSEPVVVYAGPGDFAATIDGLEVHPDPDLNCVYYSDAEKGAFWEIDIATGEPSLYATAGFKQSIRDGRAIFQNGLAIDRDGNLYADNAASDDSFGGRIFRFKQTNGSRENCGVINYFSQLLGFAHPVLSGPMVIRPMTPLVNEPLIVAENLSQEIRQVDVNEGWPVDRRVGKLYGRIPAGGWGRVIDMEFDQNDLLYVLDGLRVLRFNNEGTCETYVVLDASKHND